MSIFIIAEIGINHDGSLAKAKNLIDIAKDAGCDAVKFQKRDIDRVYAHEFLASPRESQWGTTQREQKLGLELSYDDYSAINEYCYRRGIEWFASAWDLESQRFLRTFNFTYNKVASAMLGHKEFLANVAAEKRYTFISTGMARVNELDSCVKIFRDFNCPFELMHCVSTYPAKEEEAKLFRIETLRHNYGCKIGFSDHHNGLVLSYAAVGMGATSIERHVTYDRTAKGSDHAASLEPNGLKQMVSGIRKIEVALDSDGRQHELSDKVIEVRKKLWRTCDEKA